MGMVLFVLFALLEIGLTVLTCTKQPEKASWYRNSTVVRFVEFAVVLAVMRAPGTGQAWRFAMGAAVLALHFAIDAIFLLVHHKTAHGNKSKLGAVVSCLVGLGLAAVSLVPAFVFTGYKGLPATGPYGVAQADAILLDQSRVETFETDGSCREVPVHFYYPETEAGAFPLVVFNHGSFGYNESNFSTYCELASNGYVVASVENPHYSLFCKDSGGNVVIVDPAFMQQAVDVQNGKYSGGEEQEIAGEWMAVRCADENFALDAIIAANEGASLDETWYTESTEMREGALQAIELTDIGRIGLFGHSIGGAVAVELGRERDDIAAVIDLDGTMLGEIESYEDGRYAYTEEPYPVPILALDNEEHGKGYSETDSYGTPYVNAYVIDRAVEGEERSFAGTDHMNFTDLPLFSPVLAGIFGMGEADPETFVLEMNAQVLAFFDAHLR